MAEGEVVKLQKHLALLREEYVKLQNKHTELERKYNLLSSIAGSHRLDSNNENNFICRLLKTISDLFDKELYSDLIIKLDGHSLKAHKFVLDARSKNWGTTSLSQINELDLSDLKHEIGYNLIKWVYTDVLEGQKTDENFYLDMMKVASQFSLNELKEKCEDGLLTFINVKNCIKFFQVAEEISANTLKAHCNELISNHWEDFTSEDFAYMPAALLYTMFKSKTKYPLHAAIKARREDVVFLYLIENDSILQIKLNEADEKLDVPLDLALRTKQESIAKNLVRNHADVNRTDKDGLTLLHKAINRTDEYSALFLVENNIKLNLQTNIDKKTALMCLASLEPKKVEQNLMDSMKNVATKILSTYGLDVNLQDSSGNTCLHQAISSNNKQIFKEILNLSKPNMEIKNKSDELPLWLALLKAESLDDFGGESFCSLLIEKGCDLNSIADSNNGDTIIHVCGRKKLEKSAIFLVNKNAKINLLNNYGESVLHIACENGLTSLVKILLENGSDPNIQTKQQFGDDNNAFNLYEQTPMHMAANSGHENILDLFIKHKETCDSSKQNSKLIATNFNIKDSEGQSVLSVCIWNNLLKIAKRLIEHNANVNLTDNEGVPLLHQAILRQCTDGALFLLNQNVDINMKSSDSLTALQLAVKRHLPLVVENLCKRGADMSVLDSNGNSPLWDALETGQEDIASILVSYDCDTTQWSKGPDNCLQTLLHRAIDENNEAVAVFLIKSRCDIDSPRKPGPNGEEPDEAKDLMTPLHLACTWGQEKVVIALVEHACEMNKQDAEGNTPLHVAIINQHLPIIEILVKHPLTDLKIKNTSGQTPFSIALQRKNNKAAGLILNREPKAAEQFDNKGKNFLHSAIQSSDIETVLLLLSVKVNVNSRVQDNQSKTPLHLAVEGGSEMIVRNLLLAGANVNDVTSSKKNALHLLAELNHASVGSICQVLLENSIDFNALDNLSNNALHIAVQFNNLTVVKILLAHSDVDVYAINAKGMNPLHVLGTYGKENSSAILDAFLETIPEYNLDQKDAKGNTCLLLAYQNGNGNLCRSIVKYGASLASYNDEGLSIFNYPVATKQLLYKLLDILVKEPPWVECETCLECKTKFTITMRKHHCRHCGRILCKRCSEKEISIMKFNLQKPVRVCDLCFDVLTHGGDQNLFK